MKNQILHGLLIDSVADSNIIMISTWNEIHNLKPNSYLLKLATAAGTSLTNYGKVQLSIIPL